MVLAISIGNTNLRYGVADTEGHIDRRGAVSVAESTLDPVVFSPFRGIDAAAIASVHPIALSNVEEILKNLNVPSVVVGRTFQVPMANRYRRPEEVGVDRLLGVLAASRLFPGEGVVVVDFGTALTFNVGSPSGEFLGGLIGIGASTAAAALAERAPRLPGIHLEEPGGVVATETGRAINDGIFWEVVGGVERILDGLRQELAWPVRVVATGGDAPLIASRISGMDRVEPDLVLQGIWLSYQMWRSGESGGERSRP